MAGIPNQVLSDAKRYLLDTLASDTLTADQGKSADDKNDLAKSVTDKEQQVHHQSTAETSTQSYNQDASLLNNQQRKQLLSVQQQLNSIDPDSLTPKQAHDLLYDLKQLISR